MNSDEIKHETALLMANLIDAIDHYTVLADRIKNLPANELTRDLWHEIQNEQDSLIDLLGMCRQMIVVGAQTIDNDALTDHIAASIIL